MEYELDHSNNCEGIPRQILFKRVQEEASFRLQTAIENNNMEETCRLLYYGADVNTPNDFNQKPINVALNNFNLNIALILINFCNDLNTINIYATYISLVNKNTPLSRRLLTYANAEEILIRYFKLFSSKIGNEIVYYDKVRFLNDFIVRCDYSGPKFLECLYEILQFPNSRLLVQNFKRKYNSQAFHNLLNALVEKNIKRKDRDELIWTWMSVLGGEISIMNINVAMYLLGNHEEVEALIYTTGPLQVCCLRILPLTIFSLALEEDINTVMCFKAFLGYWYNQGIPELITFSRREIKFDPVQIVLSSLLYFTIPREIQKVFLKEFKHTPLYCVEVLSAIVTAPRVPKLIELSRDKSREYIKQTFNVQEPYQFHDAVKKLEIPNSVKDIIRFKTPIYEQDDVPIF